MAREDEQQQQQQQDEQSTTAAAAAAVATAIPSTEQVQYTIVEDLAETIIDLDARYPDARRADATTVAYAVATVHDWNSTTDSSGAPTTTSQQHAICHSSTYGLSQTTTATENLTSMRSSLPVAAAATVASPSDTNMVYSATATASLHSTVASDGASYSRLDAAADAIERTEEKEVEKEEIANLLSGIPTAGVYCEAATVIRNDDDEEELLRMKQRAMRQDDEALLAFPDREPQPEPLPGEDFLGFYARTIDHWNILAAERLTGSGSELNIDTLEDESTRMASQRWQEMQPINNAEATVVCISEGDVHPSDLGAIQAELVGQRHFNPRAIRDTSTDVATSLGSSSNANTTVAATAVTAADDTTTEATVIDSAPLTKEEGREAWQTTEEAQVLENVTSEVNPDDIPEENDKPPAISRSVSLQMSPTQSPRPSTAAATTMRTAPLTLHDYAVADQEGLVLAIEDDVHPSDFDGHDAAAQIVGPDFGYTSPDSEAIATATGVAAVAESTQSGCGDDDDEGEVQAVLVQGDDAVDINNPERTMATNTTINASASAAVSVLPMESITVEQGVEEITIQPTKEVPWSGPPLSEELPRQTDANTDEDPPTDEFVETPPPPPPNRESFGNAARDQSAASGTSERSSCSSQRSQFQNVGSELGLYRTLFLS